MLIIGNNFYLSRNIRKLETACVETHFVLHSPLVLVRALGKKLNLVTRFALILLVVLFTW